VLLPFYFSIFKPNVIERPDKIKIPGERMFAKDGFSRGTTLIPEMLPALDADNARLRRDLLIVRKGESRIKKSPGMNAKDDCSRYHLDSG